MCDCEQSVVVEHFSFKFDKQLFHLFPLHLYFILPDYFLKFDFEFNTNSIILSDIGIIINTFYFFILVIRARYVLE